MLVLTYSENKGIWKMKFLIYGINYAPELTGIGKYTGEMCEWLTKQGHEVRVVTSPPYYPAWKIGNGYSTWRYRRETLQGVDVTRCPLYVPSKPSAMKRLLHLFSFALLSSPIVSWKSLTWRPHIVVTLAPAFFCAPCGWFAARCGGGTAWLHIQDFELDAAFELGILRSSILRKTATWVESFVLNRFDRISTISNRMRELLTRKGVASIRTRLFVNWVDTNKLRPIDNPNPMRRELGIADDTIIVLYSGNLGAKQGLETVIGSARILKQNTQIRFIICGDGANREHYQQLASDLPNVTFLPLQPIEKLNLLLNLGDIHLVPQRAGAADLVMPSKLSGILAVGGVVVATAHEDSEVARAVRAAHGFICPHENPEVMAETIAQISAKPEERKEIRIAARAYAEKYLGREQILGGFLKVVSTPNAIQEATELV